MATFTANSASETDVQAAVNLSSNGDTVLIPNGTVSWSTGVTVTKQITVKAQNLTPTSGGSPTRNVTITNNCASNPVFAVTIGSSFSSGIGGIAFVEGSGDRSHVAFSGTGKPPLLFDCYFENKSRFFPADHCVDITCAGGVMWNCRGQGSFSLGTVGEGWLRVKVGGNSWTTADTMGSHDTGGVTNFYIEDCTFKDVGLIDGDDNARYVVRFSTLDGSWAETHGFTSIWGGRHWEFYNTTFSVTTTGKNLANRYFWCRAGTGIFTDNVINDATDTSSYGHVHVLDIGDNTTPNGSYLIPRQPGCGHNGTNYISDPIYIWNNTGAQQGAAVGLQNGWGSVVVQNRDFFLNNGAKPGYSKFTYPHPLRGGSPADTTPPSVPTGLTTTVLSAAQIRLNWTASTDNVDPAGSIVYLAEHQGGAFPSFVQFGISAAGGTTITDTGLTGGTTYSYRIRARDTSSNLSAYSSTVNGTTSAPDVTAPSVPSSFTATVASSSQINLAWTQSTDNVDPQNLLVYVIQRKTGAAAFATIATTAAGASTFQDQGLASSTNYVYQIQCKDTSNNASAFSTSATATTSAASTTPTFVQVVAYLTSPATTAAITYPASQTAGNCNVVFVGYSSIATTVTSVVDNRGNTYTRAIGPTVFGDLTLNTYVAPNIVGGSTTVTVTFSGSTNFPDIRCLEYSGIATSSPVQASAFNSGTSTTSSAGPITTISPNAMLVAANQLDQHTNTPGAGYTQRILTAPNGDVAEDQVASATGSYSATANISGGAWVMHLIALTPGSGGADTTPPTVPTNLATSNPQATSLTLSWTASTDNSDAQNAIVYLLEHQGGAFPSFVQFLQTAGGAVTATDTGLASSTTYSYRIRSKDTAGNMSAYTSTVTGTTLVSDSTPPTVPANLAAGSPTSSSILVTWTTSTDPDNASNTLTYTLKRTQGAGSTNIVGIPGIASGTISYTDTGLSSATLYSYQVQAVDSSNNSSAFSSSVSATTLAASSSPVFIQGAVDSSGGGTTPTLVQHLGSASNNNVTYQAGLGNPGSPFKINLPNPCGAGNCLILSVSNPFSPSRTIAVTDDKSNTWALAKTVNDGSVMTSIYLALNVVAATQKFTVTFDTTLYNCQFCLSEFYNVVSASALDGTSSATTTTSTIASPSITTTAPGDLIYQYGYDASNTLLTSGGITGFTGPAGFKWLSADVMLGVFAQYTVQAAAGSITPTCTVSGVATDHFNTCAIALKSAAQGTAPASGIRIVHAHHINLWRQGQHIVPCSGNLLYLTAASGPGNCSITAVSTNPSNTWTQLTPITGDGNGPPQSWWSGNAATAHNMTLSMTSQAGSRQASIIVYDITGAATSPFDKSNATTPNGIGQSFNEPPGNWSLGTIVPATANGLILITMATYTGVITAETVASHVFDAVTYGNQIDSDLMDNADGYAHYYNPNTSSVTFGWTQKADPGDGPTSPEAIQIVAFKGGGASPPAPLTATYTAAQAVGNCNVIACGWKDTTAIISSVTDSSGNTYTLAVATAVSGLSQSIYVAKNIAAHAAGNIVTVAFTGTPTTPDLRITEYSGVDPVTPVETTAFFSGVGNTAICGPLTIAGTADLIFSADTATTTSTASGPTYTQRLLSAPGNMVEDKTLLGSGTFLATTSFGGAVYYASSSTGNDNNSGTSPNTPWKNCPGMTAYTGAGVLAPGDTVYFNRADTWLVTGTQGLYLLGGVIYIGNSWGSGSARAIIRANANLSAGVVRFRDHSTIETVLEGFEVDGASFVTNGVDINHAFFSLMNGAMKRVRDCDVHHNWSRTSLSQFTYGLIISNHGGASGFCDNVEILNTIVHDTSRDAICLYPGDENAQCRIQNITVRGCEAYNTGLDPDYGAGAGVLVKGFVNNAFIEFNYCHNTKGAHYFVNGNETNHFGVGPTNIHFRYNIATGDNNNGSFRIYDGASGQDPKDIKIYGNIIYNSTLNGGLYIDAGLGNTLSLLVYNNTFYNSPVFFNNFSATITTFEFRNNIIFYQGGVPLTDQGAKISAHSNNLIFGSGTLVSSGANTYNSGSLTTYEASALSSNPLFSNVALLPTGFTGTYTVDLAPNATGLSLQGTSPAVGTGFTLASPYNSSINSKLRSSGSFERGAYEQ